MFSRHLEFLKKSKGGEMAGSQTWRLDERSRTYNGNLRFVIRDLFFMSKTSRVLSADFTPFASLCYFRCFGWSERGGQGCRGKHKEISKITCRPLLKLLTKSFVIKHSSAFVILPLTLLACVTGVRRGGKGERRARETLEDRTREDRAHCDFPPFLRTATQAIVCL